MSDCDDHKSKPVDDRSTVDAQAVKKPIWKWVYHNHCNYHNFRNIFWPKASRHEARYCIILISTSLVWFMS